MKYTTLHNWQTRYLMHCLERILPKLTCQL